MCHHGIYGRALFVLQQFVLSISTTAPAGQIGLNERVAGIVKPSAGASNKGHLRVTLFAKIVNFKQTKSFVSCRDRTGDLVRVKDT